jgi:formate-dependent nitrite reductase membrane component NrfD
MVLIVVVIFLLLAEVEFQSEMFLPTAPLFIPFLHYTISLKIGFSRGVTGPQVHMVRGNVWLLGIFAHNLQRGNAVRRKP